jgi:hypothetical protein
MSTAITTFISIASSDAFADPKEMTKNVALNAMKTGYECLLASHVSEWATIFTSDLVGNYTLVVGSLLDNDFIVVQAIMAVMNLFICSRTGLDTIGENALTAANNTVMNHNIIQVSGLGSDSYGDLIFSDAETWAKGEMEGRGAGDGGGTGDGGRGKVKFWGLGYFLSGHWHDVVDTGEKYSEGVKINLLVDTML